MVSLLQYMDVQHKVDSLSGYIDGWLETKDGVRFREVMVERIYAGLPDGKEE